MSTQNGPATKIFGMRLRIKPKYLLGGLLAILGCIMWVNLSTSESGTASRAPVQREQIQQSDFGVSLGPHRKQQFVRRSALAADLDKLKLPDVYKRRAQIDPTLRLSVLTELQNGPEPGHIRNLFRTAEAAAPLPVAAAPIAGPSVPVDIPVAVTPVVLPLTPVVVAPMFKYSGFVQSNGGTATRDGLFVEGDSVLFGAEGSVVDQRYLVVKLSKDTALIEDLQTRTQQSLPVVAEVK